MPHLPSELLRRYIDEPDVLLTYEKEHLLGCTRCRARLDDVREHAHLAGTALGEQDSGAVDVATALRATKARPAVDRGRQFEPRGAPLNLGGVRIAGGLAAVALVALAITYTPLRTYAETFLTIFQPHAFRAVGLTRADISKLQGLPNLDAFGTRHQSLPPHFSKVVDFATASRDAHMPIASPAYLPSAVPRQAAYRVSTVSTASFTFSAAKARAFAKRKGTALPAMPTNLDGARLMATVGPVIVQHYGKKGTWEAALRQVQRDKERSSRSRAWQDLPADTIVVTQARAPKVVSSGATVAEIESYLLRLPGVPADLAAQIRAIGDPTHTVPVPFRIDKENAQTVNVQGVQALLVGDNTGVGSGVLWQKNGTVYGVAGPFAADEILKVANSLKI